MRPNFFIIIMVLLLGYAAFGRGASQGSLQVEADFVSVEKGDHYFEYDLVGAEREYEMHVVYLEKVSGMLVNMGFAYNGSLIDPVGYNGFKEVLASGRCPAAYLNQHAENFLLMAADSTVASRLAKARGRDRGMVISMRGRPLRFAMGEIKGAALPGFSFGNSQALLIREAEVS